LGTCPVREHEVEDHSLRRSHGRSGERTLGRLRSLDLVACCAQTRLQGAQNLALVVYDEDARLAHCLDSSAAIGSASTNVAPCPSRDSAQTRPPFDSANPRAMARPRPAPRAPSLVAR